MKKGISILIIMVLCLFGCKYEVQNPDLTIIPIKRFETDLEFNYLTVVPNRNEISQTDTSIALYFKTGKRGKILNYKLKRDKLIFVRDIAIKNLDFFCRYFIVSPDSIYSFISNTHQVTIKNRNDSVLNTINISKQYTPATLPHICLLNSNNDFILGNASNSIGVAKKKDRLKYYREIKPVLLLSINNSNVFSKGISQFPQLYKTSGNNYYDYYPSACFGKNGNICVSFGADDDLTLYHDSIPIILKKAKSKYIDKFTPYPDDKCFDMVFLKNYINNEPKFIRIVYDPYDSLYYRIVKHRAKQTKEGEMRSSWSVIFLDGELNLLGEIMMDTKFEPGIFIPTPFGILMAKESTMHPGKAVLTLQKIERNDK